MNIIQWTLSSCTDLIKASYSLQDFQATLSPVTNSDILSAKSQTESCIFSKEIYNVSVLLRVRWSHSAADTHIKIMKTVNIACRINFSKALFLI